LGVVVGTTPKGPPLVVRVPAELREALEKEAAFLRAPLAEVARRWMEGGATSAWTAQDEIHGRGDECLVSGFSEAACGAEGVRLIGPKHRGWPGVTCPECRRALGLEAIDAT
jgi:hypothetical protein